MPDWVARVRARPERALADALGEGVVADQKFVDADAAGEAQAVAFVAAGGAVEFFNRADDRLNLPFLRGSRFVRLLAGGAELSHPALSEDAGERGADGVGLYAQMREAGDRGGSVAGVERGETTRPVIAAWAASLAVSDARARRSSARPAPAGVSSG